MPCRSPAASASADTPRIFLLGAVFPRRTDHPLPAYARLTLTTLCGKKGSWFTCTCISFLLTDQHPLKKQSDTTSADIYRRCDGLLLFMFQIMEGEWKEGWFAARCGRGTGLFLGIGTFQVFIPGCTHACRACLEGGRKKHNQSLVKCWIYCARRYLLLRKMGVAATFPSGESVECRANTDAGLVVFQSPRDASKSQCECESRYSIPPSYSLAFEDWVP